MKVGRVGGDHGVDKRRHTRYAVTKPAHVELPAAAVEREYQAELQDISVSGAAIHTDAKLDSDQFVRLRVEGMVPVPARVVRSYQGGLRSSSRWTKIPRSDSRPRLTNWCDGGCGNPPPSHSRPAHMERIPLKRKSLHQMHLAAQAPRRLIACFHFRGKCSKSPR